MTPERRALVHEYGYAMIRRFLDAFGDVSDEALERACQRERKKRSL